MNDEIELKPCTGCKHLKRQHNAGAPQDVCYHPKKAITGCKNQLIGIDAGACRYSKLDCGPNAIWFEAGS